MKIRAIDLFLLVVFFVLVSVTLYVGLSWNDKDLVYRLIYEGL